MLFLFISCRHRELKSEMKDDYENEDVKSVVQFMNGNLQITSFNVEIARTDEERARGLMFRKSLPEDRGMLFIFENERDHHFWMKNTYIPLDMIFINSNLEVVGIFENATPMSLDSISIGKSSRYVLEINGGLSGKFGINTSTRAVFINIFP